MRINYQFKNLLEYIPSRYIGLSASQLQDRQSVYDFKDGRCPQSVFDGFCKMIREITCQNSGDWVICFVPASTKAKTAIRFGNLASRLNCALESVAKAVPGAINVVRDHAASHLTQKSDTPTEDFSFDNSLFQGKKVILIDDVITRGRTFNDTADSLMRLGAASVVGLFVAKTIHPDLPIGQKSSSCGWENDEYIDELAQEALFDEMMEHEEQQDMYPEDFEDEMEQQMYDEMMQDEYEEQCYEEEMMGDYCY